MQLNYMKATIVAAWLVALSVVSVALNVTSWAAWSIIAVFALFPPLVMLLWWKDPAQTMSESIHKAR
jgi:hypothetical protein